MSQLKKLAGETAIYGVSSILGRMLNYLLVPIYTAYFASGQYGIVTELYAYVAFFNVLYTYGLETTYFRYASQSKEKEPEIFNNAVSAIFFTSIIFSSLLIVFSSNIVEALGYPGQSHYVTWFAIILAIDAIVAIPFAKLRLDKKPVKFAIAKLSNIFINIFLNLFFIVFSTEVYEGNFLADLRPLVASYYRPEWGVDYIFLANLVASAAMVFILWKELSIVRFKLNKETLKPMLKYSYPLLFMGIAGVTNEMFSRPMIKHLLPDDFYPQFNSQQAMGIFGACYKLSIFMNLTIQAFRYSAEPFFFSQSKEKNSPETFSTIMHWFIIICSLIFFAVSINLEWIGGIFLRRPEYLFGLPIVPILLLAYLFLGVYYNLTIWFKLTDRTYFGTWLSFGGAILTIILSIILIPTMGLIGAALVTLISYVLMTIACYFIGQKHYPIPYKVRQGVLYIILTALATFLVRQLNFDNQIIATSFHFLLIIAYILIVFLLEKKNIKNNFARVK
jgi:O-antigen/teichoic acid export membrane protein